MIHTREWEHRSTAPIPEQPCPICGARYSRDALGQIQQIVHDLSKHGLEIRKDG